MYQYYSINEYAPKTTKAR